MSNAEFHRYTCDEFLGEFFPALPASIRLYVPGKPMRFLGPLTVSRFWSEDKGRARLRHAAEEMGNLQNLLPELYEISCRNSTSARRGRARGRLPRHRPASSADHVRLHQARGSGIGSPAVPAAGDPPCATGPHLPDAVA